MVWCTISEKKSFEVHLCTKCAKNGDKESSLKIPNSFSLVQWVDPP